ncbi:MAG: TauD/TfdA family dioxygenase [Alphaproteobacteria bacterium]|nr:TauD/TfdA family dioxygenase [Alphaproteobacteria bacterium]
MVAAARQAISGPVAWTGKDLEASGGWIRRLSSEQIATLDAALAAVNRAGIPTLAIRREDFPLPGFAPFVADLREELENGYGVVRVGGLPIERYAMDDVRRLFWGFGTHIGTALHQNARGELIGEVRDESGEPEPSYVQPTAGRVKSSRARARSNGPLRFHTDRCDVIALLCAQNSMAGGVSKIASIATIHNEILRRRPDLLEVLYQDFYRSRPEDEDGLHAERWFKLPVFGMVDGKLTSQYSRTYVEQAQEFDDVPRVTPAQVEAMDMLAEIAEANCLYAPFVEGDMQFLNNHVIYHGRTAYEDDPVAGKARRLMRLWLSVPNSRPLPAGFENFWGSTAPGALRGGVQVQQVSAAA